MAQTAVTRPMKHNDAQGQRRPYQIKRQFSSQRRIKELVRDLLRAHSGE